VTRPRPLFLLLVGAALLQSIYYYPQLSDLVASNFDGAGQPNAWSPKEEFIIISQLMIVLIVLAFMVLPKTIQHMPERWLNLPYKEFWLASERRDQTLAILRDQLLWVGIVHLILAMYIAQLVFDANLSGTHRLSERFLWALAAYVLFVLVWLVQFLRRFKRPAGKNMDT